MACESKVLIPIYQMLWITFFGVQTFPRTIMNGHPYARLNTFHGPKRQLLGNQAGHAAPSWRMNGMPTTGQGLAGKGKNVMEQGSKIFLSRLPVDVEEKEVEVSMRAHASASPHFCSTTFILGAVQENNWAAEGVVPHIQLAR
jgi:hypothetical protein